MRREHLVYLALGLIACLSLFYVAVARNYYLETGGAVCVNCGALCNTRAIYHVSKAEPVSWKAVHIRDQRMAALMEAEFGPCAAHLWAPRGGITHRRIFVFEVGDYFGVPYHVVEAFPPHDPWPVEPPPTDVSLLRQMPSDKRVEILKAIRGSDSWTGRFAKAMVFGWGYRKTRGESDESVESFWHAYRHLLQHVDDAAIAERIASSYAQDPDPFIAVSAQQTLNDLKLHSIFVADERENPQLAQPFAAVDRAASLRRGQSTY